MKTLTARAALAAALGLAWPLAWAQGQAPTAGTAAPTIAPLVQVTAGQPALGAGWRLLTLPQQKPPVTQYTAEVLEGRPALRIDARASYGNMALALAGPAPATLRWAWRVDRPNPALDLKTKPGDDSPAKVCLAFDLPLERVPFLERELLRFARTRSPIPLPAATLCWVWGHAEAAGTMVRNPYTQRVRVIVLRNRADASGRWFEEQRDVAADFRTAFGDESAVVPPVTAVLVGGDADNTGAQSLAFVAGLQFEGLLPAAPAIPAAGK